MQPVRFSSARVASVTIALDPDPQRLLAQMRALRGQVDMAIVVDNGSAQSVQAVLASGPLPSRTVSHEVSAVTAACMLVSRDAFEEVNGFDEQLAVGFGDVDLCLRIGETRRRIVFCPRARLLHHESLSRGTSTSDPHPEDSALYRMKWRNILRAGDPFFHPALSLWHPTWTLKHPLPASFEIQRRVTRNDSDRRMRWMP